jgi:hypothetical protein
MRRYILAGRFTLPFPAPWPVPTGSGRLLPCWVCAMGTPASGGRPYHGALRIASNGLDEPEQLPSDRCHGDLRSLARRAR